MNENLANSDLFGQSVVFTIFENAIQMKFCEIVGIHVRLE